MAWIQNLDHLDRGFVKLTRGDIPESPRLKASIGSRLDDDEAEFFASVSGGRLPPTKPCRELWVVVGRRSGKSRIAAAIAVHQAALCKHKLSAGEVGTILVLAPSKAQASIILGYCRGFLQSSPMLTGTIESEVADEIRLRNGIVIAVHAASFRNVRGRTILCAIYDEISWWRSDDEIASSNPDREINRAIMPSLTASGGRLVAISSPYRRVGLLAEKHRAHFGSDGDPGVLVIQAKSTDFNPTLDEAAIARDYADDSEAASSEWGGQWRNDLSSFLDDATVDAAVDHGRPRELPPQKRWGYHAFCDPSGGRSDAMTLAVGHREGENFVCDVIRAHTPPFDPSSVVAEYAQLCRDYHVHQVVGDLYGGEWISSAFRDAGLSYEKSEMTASQLFLESLSAFARGIVSIPDDLRLVRELKALERRTHRAGKDVVSHPAQGHDDAANALVGCLRLAVRPPNMLQSGGLEGGYGTLGPNWRPRDQRCGSWGLRPPPPPYSPPIPPPTPRLYALGSEVPDPFPRSSYFRGRF